MLLILLPDHGAAMATAVTLIGVAVLPSAWGARGSAQPSGSPRSRVVQRTGAIWAVLIVLLSFEPWRALLVMAWVGSGLVLLRRGRRLR